MPVKKKTAKKPVKAKPRKKPTDWKSLFNASQHELREFQNSVVYDIEEARNWAKRERKVAESAKATAEFMKDRAMSLGLRAEQAEKSNELLLERAYSCGFKDHAEGKASRVESDEAVDVGESPILSVIRLEEIRASMRGCPSMDDLRDEFIPALIAEIDRVRSEQRSMAYYAVALRVVEERLLGRGPVPCHIDQLSFEDQKLAIAELNDAWSKRDVLVKENTKIQKRMKRLNVVAEGYRLKLKQMESQVKMLTERINEHGDYRPI